MMNTGSTSVTCRPLPDGEFKTLREGSRLETLNRLNVDVASIDLRHRPAEATPSYSPFIAFGRFQLCASQRLLLEDNKRVNIGSRPLDLLIALLDHPGEIVSKQELIARVWPDLTVEQCNLRTNIATLRRALHDGATGTRYISTVNGRGYCFVAPVMRYVGPIQHATTSHADGSPHSEMPPRFAHELLHALATDLSREPIVAILVDGDLARSVIAMAADQHPILGRRT
jgi:DNA-binding winged helix-turn-helix (wHTH) protein